MDFGRKKGKLSYSDNLLSTMRMNVVKRPHSPAVMLEDITLSWAELWERSNRLGNALIKLGLKKGDRIQIFLPNCLEYPEVVIGGNKAGLIDTAGNFRLTGKELIYQLNDCGARAIILKSREQYENLKEVRNEVPNLEHVIIIDDHDIKGCLSYYELLNNSSPEEPDVDNLPGDVKEEGCVGKAIFDLELCAFDEHGKPVKPGEPGILYGRGFSMWEGYLNNPEATRAAYLDHEWGTVGDIVRQDEEGDFIIVDRKNDMIITGGINVYPAEVEKVILTMPGVQDVAVIGVPDDKWGEAVKALVVKKPDSSVSEDEIISHCRNYLAGFKVPKSVDFIDQIPRSFIGKPLKRELRKKYWENQDSKLN